MRSHSNKSSLADAVLSICPGFLGDTAVEGLWNVPILTSWDKEVSPCSSLSPRRERLASFPCLPQTNTLSLVQVQNKVAAEPEPGQTVVKL